MTKETEQLHLDDKAEAVAEYRAARTSPWGCELPESLLGEVFSRLGWRCKAVRLVCAGWQGAHDKLLPRLRWLLPGGAFYGQAPLGLERVGGHVENLLLNADRFVWFVSQLQSLPALTSLTLQIPDSLTAAAALALGSLTMLTSLELHRGADFELLLTDAFEEEMYATEEEEEELDSEELHMRARGAMYLEYVKQRDELRELAAMDNWWQALRPLTRLTYLDLSKCVSVTDQTLAALTGLTALACLKLSDPVVAAGERHCVEVDLRHDHSITDEGMQAMAQLAALTSLELSNFGLTVGSVLGDPNAVQALQAALPHLVVTTVTYMQDPAYM